jgi:hypothetical protein
MLVTVETVRTPPPDATAHDVARSLREHDTGSLIVCTNGEAGVLVEPLPEDGESTTAGEVAATPGSGDGG